MSQVNSKTVSKAKASEYQITLLHLMLPLLVDILPTDMILHLSLLVTAIHILHQDEFNDTDIKLAEEMMNE